MPYSFRIPLPPRANKPFIFIEFQLSAAPIWILSGCPSGFSRSQGRLSLNPTDRLNDSLWTSFQMARDPPEGIRSKSLNGPSGTGSHPSATSRSE